MIGFLFAASGMIVFLSMIAVTELSRLLRALYAYASAAAFKHDTDVFPDFNPYPQ